MGISKNREHRSRQPVVRTRLAGTPIEDTRIPASYDPDITMPDSGSDPGYIDIEVDASGTAVTSFGNQGT